MDDIYARLPLLHDTDIRLLTIHPDPQRTGAVHCTLTVHSLADTTPAYQTFLSSPAQADDPYLTKRQLTTRWKQATTTSRSNSTVPQPLKRTKTFARLHATNPPLAKQRWRWGDYAALSYAWGDASQTETITLNGCRVQVTANLAGVLRFLAGGGEFSCSSGSSGSRSQGARGGEEDGEEEGDGYGEREGVGKGFRLWVDALCINQRDLEERGRQLGKMRGVYGSAWCVVAWLGPEQFQSGMAVRLLRDLAELSEACANKASGVTGEMIAACLEKEPDFLGSGCWSALNRLMERAYWYRLWIVQEIVMGASATWLRCGPAEIDWDSFCTAVGFLEDHLWLVKDIAIGRECEKPKEGWTVGSLHLVYQDLSALSEREENGGAFPSFGRLLDLARFSACKVPADKVYALVGLMEPRIAERLRPNYTLPVARVYASTARTFIEVYDNLEPLREGNPWGPSKAPSWAADWQWRGRLRWSRVESRLWCEAIFSNESPSTTADTYVPFSASGETKHDSLFSIDSSLLICSGFIFDSVSGLGARGVGYFDMDRHSIVHPRTQWKSAYGDLNGTIEALARTLIMDRVAGGRRAENRHMYAILNLPATFAMAEGEFLRRGWSWLAGQEGYFFRWANFRKANGKFPLGIDWFDDFFTDEIPAEPEVSERDMSEAYSCFDRTSHKRRFMTTAKGYMGWAPDNVYGDSDEQAREGDLIAILFGCSTPIMIRPCGWYFQVLGEAYVQGMMEGEAMQLLEEGTCEVQKFTFC